MAFFPFYRVVVSLVILFAFLEKSSAQSLSPTFYDRTCPQLVRTVTDVLNNELKKDPRMGASLLRLHFHDCFVNGCDGSILLDDTSNSLGEKSAAPNVNSLRGFEVIDTIKNKLESVCRGVVSCADILALAAQVSVHQLGGRSWALKFGRKDSRTASKTTAETNLPTPTMNLNTLEVAFSRFKFTTTELVALTGAHTIGRARCTNYRNRIYNEKDIDAAFVRTLRRNCAMNDKGVDGNNTAPLDITENKFDNSYFFDISGNKGLLHSDQQLYNNNSRTNKNSKTNPIVENYKNNPGAFFNDFAKAMMKMSELSSPPGGEIRKNCRKAN